MSKDRKIGIYVANHLGLNKYGLNSSSNKLIKKIKLKNKLKVNLGDDVVYKEKISNV